jgi:hypothetical protein
MREVSPKGEAAPTASQAVLGRTRRRTRDTLKKKKKLCCCYYYWFRGALHGRPDDHPLLQISVRL